MTRLSVLEAAALSGRAPEEIRALIEQGRLVAERVELPGGPQYLVEARSLAGLGPLPRFQPSTGVTRRRVRAALDGLRAALARRLEPEHLDDEALTRPGGGLPTPVGLNRDELAQLGERVERLLGTNAHSNPG